MVTGLKKKFDVIKYRKPGIKICIASAKFLMLNL